MGGWGYVMKCPTCGNDNEGDANFCMECGASLSASTPIGVGAASSEPPTGSFPKTIKPGRLRRIMPWMWIGLPVVLVVLLWLGYSIAYANAWCPPFLGCEDWGHVMRGNSYAELGQYERAIQEYDETIRLERNLGNAYYERGLAYEALGKTIEAERDFKKAIQLYDENILDLSQTEWVRSFDFYGRGLAYEALGKPEEAARDFQKAKELEYNDDGGQSSGLPESGPATSIFLDDFTKITEVAPLVLEGEISGGFRYQSWSFEGNKGQILQFESRPKPESHIDFEHVRKTLFTGQGDSREGKEDAHFEVIARDEQLEEIELPYTGTYTLSFEGNPENSSGAYTITISRR
jgi:tetratricopeptide (TPR) repeat protein